MATVTKTTAPKQHPGGTWAPWLPVFLGLCGVCLIVIDRGDIFSDLAWWHLIPLTLIAVAATVLVTLIQMNVSGGERGWEPVFVHRILTVLAAGTWATWVSWKGWSFWPVMIGLGSVVFLITLGLFCQSPGRIEYPHGLEEDAPPARDPVALRWENLIKGVSTWSVKVIKWEKWQPNPEDGMDLYVELPVDKGVTADEFAPKLANLAAAARLDDGCVIEIGSSGVQGVMVLKVMLRNPLNDVVPEYVEPTTPASVYDPFPVLRTPRGEWIEMALRLYSMIVGGAPDSGKTTFLHRIIMWLARCTDTVIWVVDLSGGGLAEPWIKAWARGECDNPVVDWVADNEPEAAAMLTAARQGVWGRRTNREAVRRRETADDSVLPVDEHMPAVVVITDEGGEVRQARSLLGQLAGQGISRLAQVGRAEGFRVIMAVLRGTADLTDKGLRVMCALRMCLRMEEHDEYSHVLGVNPPKIDMGDARGAGFAKTPKLRRPAYGRTVNVKLSGIHRHSIATSPLRPELDPWTVAEANKVTPVDIIGKQPLPEIARLPVMQDAMRGELYTARWIRYERKLAEMRGDDPAEAEAMLAERYGSPDDDYADAPIQTRPSGTGVSTDPTGPMLADVSDSLDALDAAWEIVTGPQAAPERRGTNGAGTPAAPAADQPPTARQRILALVSDAGPEGISAAELERSVGVTPSRVQVLLKELRGQNLVGKNSVGLNVLTQYAVTGGSDVE